MRIAPGFRFSLALMFVVFVFSPLQLVSQVIIKEKVEIHPKSPPPVRTQSAALLQIVASWSVSGEIDPSPGPGLGMINQPCGITATGELVKTAPAVSGGFFIGASVRTLGSVHYELLVQVGGTEVLRQEGELPGNILFLLQPEVVLHSGVAFHGEQQTLIHGAGTGMKLGTPSEHPLQLCGETIWHQKMPTMFTIVQGGSLGSFYDTSGTRIGTSVQWTEETIGAIRFVADGDQPTNPEGEDVIIEASNSTGILGQTTIRVYPFEETIVVDHFEVSAGTDTLEYGISTPLVIVAKDAAGREPQGEDQDFLVALSLEGGEGSAGSFAVTVPFMDTTFVFPDQFMFSYVVYKSGQFSIAYLANGDVPTGTDPGTVKIKAVLETDPEVNGETQVVVMKESGCESAPECPPTSFIPPLITLQVQSNGFGGIDVCKKSSTGGAFAPVVGKDLLQPFTVDACFDRTFGKWRFQVPTITFNVIQDLCYQNIYNNGQELVNSVSEISASDCERAKRDFRLHANYPIADPNDQNYKVKFLITQALLFHEELHKLDFQNIINFYQQEWANKFSSYQPSCDEVRSVEDARAKGQSQINITLDEHWRKILSVSRERTGDQEEIDKGNPVEIEKRKKNEEKIQNSPLVQIFVRDFVASLNCQ